MPKEVYSKVKSSLDSGLAEHSDLLSSGELFVRSSKTESVYVSTYEKGRSKDKPTTDLLFNETAVIPPRPTAGALQWAKGQSTAMTVDDLSLLIAGPNRKPTKNPESQLAHNISPEANVSQGYGGYNILGARGGQHSDKPYDEPVRRTGTSGLAGGIGTQGFMKRIQEGIQSVEETFNDYANNASEAVTGTVEEQKKNMYSSAFKSKFGF